MFVEKLRALPIFVLVFMAFIVIASVAGVATLLLSAHPHLTVAQVTETLMMSAKHIGNAFNNKCGAGRVDIVAAIEYAAKKFPVGPTL